MSCDVWRFFVKSNDVRARYSRRSPRLQECELRRAAGGCNHRAVGHAAHPRGKLRIKINELQPDAEL